MEEEKELSSYRIKLIYLLAWSKNKYVYQFLNSTDHNIFWRG